MGVEKRREDDRAIRGLVSPPVHKQSEMPKFVP